jgi:hypothetical protein
MNTLFINTYHPEIKYHPERSNSTKGRIVQSKDLMQFSSAVNVRRSFDSAKYPLRMTW